jgi:uncharacterized protein YndB with AHSA1/START domain
VFSVVESATIPRPPAEVFAAAADPHTQLTWDAATLKSVEQLSSGPLERGARFRGDFKGMGRVEYEFVEYEPPRRMPLGEVRHVFTLEAADGGTRLTQEGRVEPNLLGQVLAPLMRRMLRRRFRTINQELSDYLTPNGSA